MFLISCIAIVVKCSVGLAQGITCPRLTLYVLYYSYYYASACLACVNTEYKHYLMNKVILIYGFGTRSLDKLLSKFM